MQKQCTTLGLQQSRQEQKEIEATREYQIEQLLHSLEVTFNALDKIAEEADERAALRAAGIMI